MPGYYEELETQLARATERGPRRRGLFAPRIGAVRFGRRLRADWIAVGLAIACSVVVALVFTQVGVERKPAPGRTTHPAHAGRPPVVRNYAPGTPPAMGGEPFCNASLTAPNGAATPTGMVVVNTRPPARYVYRITASGLAPSRHAEVYEVWLRPATRAPNGAFIPLNGEAPVLLGQIAPPIGPSGRLVAQGVSGNGLTSSDYILLITVQHESAKAPGRVVLEGDLPL
jgi:hypothetical protein